MEKGKENLRLLKVAPLTVAFTRSHLNNSYNDDANDAPPDDTYNPPGYDISPNHYPSKTANYTNNDEDIPLTTTNAPPYPLNPSTNAPPYPPYPTNPSTSVPPYPPNPSTNVPPYPPNPSTNIPPYPP